MSAIWSAPSRGFLKGWLVAKMLTTRKQEKNNMNLVYMRSQDHNQCLNSHRIGFSMTSSSLGRKRKSSKIDIKFILGLGGMPLRSRRKNVSLLFQKLKRLSFGDSNRIISQAKASLKVLAPQPSANFSKSIKNQWWGPCITVLQKLSSLRGLLEWTVTRLSNTSKTWQQVLHLQVVSHWILSKSAENHQASWQKVYLKLKKLANFVSHRRRSRNPWGRCRASEE